MKTEDWRLRAPIGRPTTVFGRPIGRPTIAFGRPIGRPNITHRAPEPLWRFLDIFGRPIGRPTERPNFCAGLLICVFLLSFRGNLGFLLNFFVYLSGLRPKHEISY